MPMLTSNIDQLHQSIESEEEEIVLAGPPSLLLGTITLRNTGKEQIWVPELPLLVKQGRKKIKYSLQVNTVIAAGTSKIQPLSLQIDPQTPPGVYKGTIAFDQSELPVRLNVEANAEVVLSPDELEVTGKKPGEKHEASIQMQNTGNVTLEVPQPVQEAYIDPDLISRRLGEAIREKGKEGTMPVLDLFVRTLRREMGGTLNVTVREAGQEVKPGKSLDLHLTLELPEEWSGGEDLEVDFEIFDELLNIRVAGSSDSEPPA